MPAINHLNFPYANHSDYKQSPNISGFGMKIESVISFNK
jgi:hypothetical protein